MLLACNRPSGEECTPEKGKHPHRDSARPGQPGLGRSWHNAVPSFSPGGWAEWSQIPSTLTIPSHQWEPFSVQGNSRTQKAREALPASPSSGLVLTYFFFIVFPPKVENMPQSNTR